MLKSPPKTGGRPLAPLPQACGSVACVALGGKLHGIGGAIGDTFDAKRSIDWHLVYDLQADRWTRAAPLPTARDHVGAMLQLTRIPGLARRGATRLLVEAVRVGSAHRSAGLGTAMLRWAMGPAAEATGSALVQLTSDEQRVDAHRFYERLGFVGSHRGFKHAVPSRRPTEGQS